MNRKQLITTLTALLALLLTVGTAIGQEPEAGAQSPMEPVTITGTVNSRISYQGLLKEGGSPVTGNRDMTFRLYSDATCSTQVGSNINKTGVQVTDGLFSVELAVTHSDFNGQGLWLEVEVGGTKIGCREILPVPYALSLRPGATIEDTTSEVNLNYSAGKINKWSKYAVRGVAEGTAADATYYGVSGRGTDYGVVGSATATSGDTVGVSGWSDSTSGKGVYGRALAQTGITHGVHGVTYSMSEATVGVWGEASSVGPNRKVNWGVRGTTDSTGGAGVSGAAPRYGVEGLADAKTGPAYGVEGWSAWSPDGRGLAGWALGTSGDTEGVFAYVQSSAGEALEAVNTGGLAPDPRANIIIACSTIDDGFIPEVECADVEFRVRRNGNVSADGSFTGGGADYADMMPVLGDPAAYSPGDVLAIGLDGKLTKASEPYSTAVAGVYSTQPAFVADPRGAEDEGTADAHGEEIASHNLLRVPPVAGGDPTQPALVAEPNGAGEEGTVDAHGEEAARHNEGLVPVALAGVVPVKASAENGAIQPGDLLTTSSTPGHAMKAEPITVQSIAIYPTGTIIGKALASLDAGTGVIEMLVVLQ